MSEKISISIQLPGGISFECTGDKETIERERKAFIKLLKKSGKIVGTDRTISYQPDTVGTDTCDSCKVTLLCPIDTTLPELFSDIEEGSCKVTLLRPIDTTLTGLLSGIEDGSVVMHMGDSFTCALSNKQEVTFVITDEDEDSLRLEMRELLKCIPHFDVEEWYKELFSMLPEELQRAIIPTKRRYMENGNGDIKEFEAFLFLPSASEVFPDKNWPEWLGDKDVYDQMEFYKNAANRVRCTANGSFTNCWWLLSARSGSSADFAFVSYDGGASAASATNTWVGAPVCFRIRKAKNAG